MLALFFALSDVISANAASAKRNGARLAGSDQTKTQLCGGPRANRPFQQQGCPTRRLH